MGDAADDYLDDDDYSSYWGNDFIDDEDFDDDEFWDEEDEYDDEDYLV